MVGYSGMVVTHRYHLVLVELHDTHGTHGTPRCQILMVPTILEILHDSTTVDYYTTGASFRYIAAARPAHGLQSQMQDNTLNMVESPGPSSEPAAASSSVAPLI